MLRDPWILEEWLLSVLNNPFYTVTILQLLFLVFDQLSVAELSNLTNIIAVELGALNEVLQSLLSVIDASLGLIVSFESSLLSP